MTELLKLENLWVESVSETRGVAPTPILRGVDLCIAPGERLALVGESGCGKTVTALSVLGLLPSPPLRKSGGRIVYHGRDLDGFTAADWRDLRGGRIGMIFQEPLTSLNPAFRVGDQVDEAVRAHSSATAKAAREETLRLFRETGLADPARVASQYPHQLSGGMCQRIMIAMALAGGPDLLLADEPTTALDVTVQAQILDLLREESKKRNLAVLLVTHDLALAEGFADSVAVCYAGLVVERGPATNVFGNAAHPYTEGLLRGRPSAKQAGRLLFSIPGTPPSPSALPKGCAFSSRCPKAQERCRLENPSEQECRPGHRTRCFYPSVR